MPAIHPITPEYLDDVAGAVAELNGGGSIALCMAAASAVDQHTALRRQPLRTWGDTELHMPENVGSLRQRKRFEGPS
ncbi:hypothetical protein NDU88_002199 [Pleurodeles waltl]|uniref:Uncharacterized protein n=1 Tax=Pleurodeles waltl TaxID=8319 RepID=A0AAV7UA29_PLEWA|nr:hypothetical protein NDU88_002199 [Pleurodeles waltl]